SQVFEGRKGDIFENRAIGVEQCKRNRVDGGGNQRGVASVRIISHHGEAEQPKSSAVRPRLGEKGAIERGHRVGTSGRRDIGANVGYARGGAPAVVKAAGAPTRAALTGSRAHDGARHRIQDRVGSNSELNGLRQIQPNWRNVWVAGARIADSRSGLGVVAARCLAKTVHRKSEGEGQNHKTK